MRNVPVRRTSIPAMAGPDLQALERQHAPVEIMRCKPENDNATAAPQPLSISAEIRNILANLSQL